MIKKILQSKHIKLFYQNRLLTHPTFRRTTLEPTKRELPFQTHTNTTPINS
ncbi:MAG: hypothetical protein [Microviridae sp. ctjyu33]|nr:MAG: hypothetical protein [Microviridae sp. ctjyu33]